MKFAYADPPYLGCCGKYQHFHPDGLCWDDLATHRALIERLVTEFPDGWALSLHVPSLRGILPLCPADIRIGAWVKSFSTFKKNVRPAYAWEPIIFRGGRNPSNGFVHPAPPKNGEQTTPKDFIIAEESPAIKERITLQKGLTGAKPASVCKWILDLLNFQEGDELVDLFVGTGIMGHVVEPELFKTLEAAQLPQGKDK
jgi:hypothetical protein